MVVRVQEAVSRTSSFPGGGEWRGNGEKGSSVSVNEVLTKENMHQKHCLAQSVPLIPPDMMAGKAG